MAIFNNGNRAPQGAKSDTNTTIITIGTVIKGEMNLSCNLYVDGEVNGTINSSKEVNIGKNGCVKGDVKTSRLLVQGYIEGSINATKVEIKAAGKVAGIIEAEELIIESKGIFEGNSIVKTTLATPVLPKAIKAKQP